MRTRSNRKSAVLSRCIESLESRQLLTTNHLVFLTQPTTTVAGVVIGPDITVAIEDASNKVVTGDSSSVKLDIKTSTGPDGAELGGTATVAAVNGVATFNDLVLNLAGSGATAYKLTATDGSLTSANSNSFAIRPSTPTKVSFKKDPTNAKAGVAISPSITVDVLDKFNNVVTSDFSNITLSIATGVTGATLNGSITTAAVNGEATFDDISLDNAGDYTLTATDAKLTTDTSTTFTISATTAAQLAFTTEPVTGVAGTTMTAMVVQVQDKYGNLVTTNTSDVTLALASSPDGATIGGTKKETAVAGVATFDAVSLQTAGAYTFSATGTSLTADTSAAFTITSAAAAKLVFKAAPGSATAGINIAPAVVALVEDQYGNVAATDASKVTAAISTGPDGAKLTGTATVPAAKGVATFSALSLATAGSYKLTVTDGSLTAAVTDSFTVSPGAATQVVFGVAPSAAVAGVAINPAVTVKVEDKFGNVVTADTSKVTMAIGTGAVGGLLEGTALVAASSGVATFSTLKLKTAGSYTLKATDGKLTAATSAAFVISPADASGLKLATAPATVVAGVSIAPAITASVVDDFGNVVTTDTSSVTMAITDGSGTDGATLSGTATVAAVKGVATFSTLSVDKAGSAYTLDASDGSLDGATTSAFNVTAAAPAKLVYKKGPTGVKAGVSISPAITVLVEDKFGNIVTTDKSKVTIGIATAPTKLPPKKKLAAVKGKVSSTPILAALSGTVTATVDGGMATFSDLSLNVAGAYTLVATDAKLTTAVSDSFTIAPNTATQVAFGTQPTTAAAGATMTAFTAQVQDAYGNVVTGNTSDVTIAIASGPDGATLGGTKKFAAVAGVATFDVSTLQTAGAYTLSASATGLTAGTSDSFTITAAAASKLVLSQAPSDGTAGAVNSPAVTVLVEDQYGNIVLTDKSKVTATVSTGPDSGALTGTASVAAAGGVATFSALTLNKAGDYKLAFADGSLTGATSDTFTIAPAVPTQLVFGQQPTAAVAGAALSPTVTVKVEDKFGNVVTSDTSKVTINTGTVPVGGAVGALVTARAVSGVASFSKLKFNLAGSYTLKALDGKLTAATSSAFAITAGDASQLAFITNPAAAVAGVKIAPAITVQVQDQYGNVVATDTSNVTIDIADGTGPNGATLGGTLTVKAVKGVATFSDLTENITGAYRLSATDDTLDDALSNTFKITNAPAAKLVMIAGPSDITAGDTLDPIVVVVEDKFGNLVTTDASKVTIGCFVSDPKGSTMGGTLTVTAVKGVATFSDLVPHTASGAETLAAIDAKLTAATSDPFVVSADSASKLVYGAAPAAAKAGATLTAVTVQVQDQFGNVVTGNTSDVTLAIATGPDGAAITGTKKVAAVAGVATFNALSLQTAGSYTLTATDTGLTSVTSPSFDITAGAAAKLAYLQAPTSAVAGVAISPAVTVQVLDQYDNVVLTDTSKVTASIDTGPSGATLGGTLIATAVKGVATFSTLALQTAGSYKIKVADGSLTTATSSSITISAAAAAKLVFGQAPSAAAKDDQIAPAITVKVTDAFGNTVTGNTSSVIMSIVTGATGATLGGTLTQAADAGVATFDDLTLDKAGTYTIKATDGSLTAVTSASFVIS